MAPRTERTAAVIVIGLTCWLWYAATGDADSGDVDRGARVYQRCYACHTIDPHEKTKLQGPSLYQVIGRRAASLTGFSYSPALTAKGEAGLVWTEDQINKFLLNPEHVVPGNQMGFFGLSDARDRTDLIAYLKDAAQR